jgi:hypothetical protein
MLASADRSARRFLVLSRVLGFRAKSMQRGASDDEANFRGAIVIGYLVVTTRSRLLIGSLICLLCLASLNTQAATFLVSNLDDVSDAGGATTDTGSLRYAMLLANASSDASNTIEFSPGLSGHIVLTAPLPLILNNLTIDGSGADITIDGNGASRPFFIGVDAFTQSSVIPASFPTSPLTRRISVALKNLTIFRGRAYGGGGASGGMGAGGAIFVNSAADVLLDNISFSQNSVVGGGGGESAASTYKLGGGGLGGPASAGGGGLYGGCSLWVTLCFGGAGAFGDAGLGGGGFSGDGAGPGQPATAGAQMLFGISGSGGNADDGNPGGAAGGGGGSDEGGGSGGGGFNAQAGTPGFGGIGGFGGGGGGVEGGTASRGGNGNFGGGGGAVDGSDGSSVGGAGGFGGGGGSSNMGYGGDGGFGAGGGAGADMAKGGHGGFGAGGCGANSAGFGGSSDANYCGGGAGFGGSIFVVEGGNILVTGNLQMSGGAVNGGFGIPYGGAPAGTGIFLQGNGFLNFAPSAGDIQVVGDEIADEIGTAIAPSTGYAAGSWAVNLVGAGTLVLAAHESHAGETIVSAGTLKLDGVTASDILVGPSGTLTGKGTASAVDSSGVFAPGATHPTVALMGLAGSATLLPGALTCFYADAKGGNTGLFSSGVASLAGRAHIDFESAPVPGTILTLIEASAISGAFDSYSSNVPDLGGSLAYSATKATFTVTSSDGIFRDGFEGADSTACASAFSK